MKKTYKFLLILLASISFASCNLDRFPESQLSDAQFWNSASDLKSACNYLYTMLPGHTYDDNRSDDQFGQSPNTISEGSRLIPATDANWNNQYKMIFAANNILEKSVTVQETQVIIDRYLGEARFFRAWAYFDLVTKYGGVPLVLKTLGINDEELLHAQRASRATVVAQIIADLDFAAANLPGYKALGSSGYGRISKSAALALKARVALYEGTRQKFHADGDPSANLQLAIDASKAVMAEGHSLYAKGSDPYYDLFQYEGEGYGVSENILSKIYGESTINAITSHNIPRNLEQGYMSSTRSLIESYLCTDGLPMDKSPLAVSETTSTSIFENKDPRMHASVFKTGDVWISGLYKPTVAFAKTGYCDRKYMNMPDWTLNTSFLDIHLIRYAEVLLIYAEATFEKSGSISDEDLDKSINLIRARVSMPSLTNAFVSANGLDMRTEIRRERRIELAQEGFRYEDIIRWKTAETVLPQVVLGARYFDSEYINVANPSLNSDSLFVVQAASKRAFDASKDYLYPLPISEISISGGTLTQNPNWVQ